jgi:hypothetical protein
LGLLHNNDKLSRLLNDFAKKIKSGGGAGHEAPAHYFYLAQLTTCQVVLN